MEDRLYWIKSGTVVDPNGNEVKAKHYGLANPNPVPLEDIADWEALNWMEACRINPNGFNIILSKFAVPVFQHILMTYLERKEDKNAPE